MNLPHELTQAVESLDEAELHALFAFVRERLRFFHSVQDLHSLQQFHSLDEVVFEHHGEHIRGFVVRTNRRTVTIRTVDRGEWKVSPVFLKKIRDAPSTSGSNGAPSHHNTRGIEVLQPAPPAQRFTVISRNAPCPCGSRRKFKNCHGKTFDKSSV